MCAGYMRIRANVYICGIFSLSHTHTGLLRECAKYIRIYTYLCITYTSHSYISHPYISHTLAPFFSPLSRTLFFPSLSRPFFLFFFLSLTHRAPERHDARHSRYFGCIYISHPYISHTLAPFFFLSLAPFFSVFFSLSHTQGS